MHRRSSGASLVVAELAPWYSRYAGLLISLALVPLAASLSVRERSHIVTVDYPTTMMLPEGSRILLGPGSKIQFRDDFARRRRLWLFGNASIEVAHGTALSIWTETALITTPGGSFAIQASGAETTYVVARSGTARLRALNEDNDPAYRRLTLGAGEAAIAIRLIGTKLSAQPPTGSSSHAGAGG